MNKLFGREWKGTPIDSELPHVEAPVGQTCQWCDEPIELTDSGIIMPFFDGTKSTEVAQHRVCHLRQIFGSVGHQNKKCSCFGGTEEDPPHMTRRQAAEAAYALFNSKFPGV